MSSERDAKWTRRIVLAHLCHDVAKGWPIRSDHLPEPVRTALEALIDPLIDHYPGYARLHERQLLNRYPHITWGAGQKDKDEDDYGYGYG